MTTPYCFELQKKHLPTENSDDWEWEDSTSSSEDEIIPETISRLNVPSYKWCMCTNCKTMPLNIECLCCREIQDNRFKRLMNEVTCVTEHEGFSPVILNKYVLWASLVSLHDREGAWLPPENNVPNRSYRYAAYRQFCWFVYAKLGRHVRRVIPSCVVLKIREAFPQESGSYVCFSGDDEVTEAIISETQTAWEYLNESNNT